MIALAGSGADEGLWLRAERQTGGRGRQGRTWDSPSGNLYASTLVRLRPGDPPPATLALVAAVALAEVVGGLLSPSPFAGDAGSSLSPREREGGAQRRKGEGDDLAIKWPNDLLLGGAKLSGILLERAGDTVVIGMGVNLAHHPELPDRPATSLAAHGVEIGPERFLLLLADAFAQWLAGWRRGLAAVREAWLAHAHPLGTPLTARLPDGASAIGTFDGLSAEGALILRLADGGVRVIHAADVFLV